MSCENAVSAATRTGLAVIARVEVRAGCAGIGWTRSGEDAFLVEKYVSGPGTQTVTLHVPGGGHAWSSDVSQCE